MRTSWCVPPFRLRRKKWTKGRLQPPGPPRSSPAEPSNLPRGLPCRPARNSIPAGETRPQLKISSTPENFLLDGAGTSQGLSRTLVLNPEIQEAVLHITARAAACDGTPDGDIPEHAACHLYQQDWGYSGHRHR